MPVIFLFGIVLIKHLLEIRLNSSHTLCVCYALAFDMNGHEVVGYSLRRGVECSQHALLDKCISRSTAALMVEAFMEKCHSLNMTTKIQLSMDGA